MYPKKNLKKNITLINILAGLICFFSVISLMNPVSVYAADAAVVFGSDDYETESGAELTAGVYIDGSEPVGYYRVEIEYDPARLEYTGGANSGGDGTVIFEGNGNDVRESTMLSFRALSGGSTTLKIRNADVRVSGRDESFNITEAAQVPVNISGEDVVAASSTTADSTEAAEAAETSESNETESSESEKATQAGEGEKQEGKNESFWVILIISVLAGGLGLILAILAARKKFRRKKRRQEYIRTYGKKQGSDTASVKEKNSVGKTITADRGPVRKEAASVAKETVVTDAETTGKERAVTAQESREEKTITAATKNKDLPVFDDSDKPIISVRDLNMRFSVSGTSNSGLKDYAIQKIKGKQKKKILNALKHVSFDIYKGEVVGIIGTNGSGKSTLLKIVSGAMQPTSGKVTADKSKIQLLTLGTGFDPELTAKENIYLNGAIIGYTKEFIDKHYDEIVEFAELEDFMDEKVKNFSSGMVSRLGFSIATVAGASEILILDEVMSVGDQFFKTKSMKRIKDMIHGGATVLIVSHSLGVISSHCDKVIWLDKGVMKMVGKPETVCAEYSRYHP